jgi:hypothetical protein
VFTSTASVRSTFTVDGFVHGMWRLERTAKRATSGSRRSQVPAAARRALTAEAERLLAFAAPGSPTPPSRSIRDRRFAGCAARCGAAGSPGPPTRPGCAAPSPADRLVTGASEGIGAATARRLAAAGATVLLVARTVERLEGCGPTSSPPRHRPRAPGRPVGTGGRARLAADLLRRYRRVDVVVSNAGRSIRRSVADTADRFHDVTRTANLNYLGPVQLLLVLLPAMRAAGGGHVVNVSTAGSPRRRRTGRRTWRSKAAFDTWLRVGGRRTAPGPGHRQHRLLWTRPDPDERPTAHYRRLPAMTADEAAAWCAGRSRTGPRTIWPWWARAGAVVGSRRTRPVERVMAPACAPPTRPAGAGAGPTGVPAPGPGGPDRDRRRRHGSTLAAAIAAGPRTGPALVDAAGPLTGGRWRSWCGGRRPG